MKTQFLNESKERQAACGKPSVCVPLLIFSDETSGNVSKKWNLLETYSMFLAGLERKELNKHTNIHFLATSHLVDTTTLGKAIAENLKGLSVIRYLNSLDPRRSILLRVRSSEGQKRG